jgi:hypothetical protein
MSKPIHILELANGQMSIEGYDKIVSDIKYLVIKFKWPKIILDGYTNDSDFWNDEEILSFTQQFLVFVLDKQKLKNYKKIPDNYIRYYFQTVLVSYAANKIKEHQNRVGLSYSDTTRITLDILSNRYFSKEINNNSVWYKEDIFSNPVMEGEDISDITAALPKVPITEKVKHFKPRVIIAISEIFEIIDRPIAQNVLIDQVFKLFDQSSFMVSPDEVSTHEIREDAAISAVKLIIDKIDEADVPIYRDYYFNDIQLSLRDISEKYKIPKSTVHHKVSRFTKTIAQHFRPENEQEGMWFLEKLHDSLDEFQ